MLIAAPLRRPNGRRDGSWDLVDLQIFAMSAGIFVFWVFIKILDYQVVVLVFGFWVLEGLMVCSFFLGLFCRCCFPMYFFVHAFHWYIARFHLHSITIVVIIVVVVVVVIIIIFIVDCYQLLVRIYFLNGAHLFAIGTVNMLGHTMDWSYAKHTLVRWSLSSYLMR